VIEHRLIVVMGVSGCGKSTVGAALAAKLNVAFFEGDLFHSDESVEKMSLGIPLTDIDRAPWIDRIVIATNTDAAGTCVLACSALTPFVRERLLQGSNRAIDWIPLILDRDTLSARMKTREHFMPADLLQSQLDAFRPPKGIQTFNANQSVDTIVTQILRTLPVI